MRRLTFSRGPEQVMPAAPPIFHLSLEGGDLNPDERDRLVRALSERLRSIEKVDVTTASGPTEPGSKSLEILTGGLLVTVATSVWDNFGQHVLDEVRAEIRRQIAEVCTTWIRDVGRRVRVRFGLDDEAPVLLDGEVSPAPPDRPPEDEVVVVSEPPSPNPQPGKPVSPSFAVREQSGKKYALLIANGAYAEGAGIPDLRCPADDARALARALLDFPDEFSAETVEIMIDRRNWEIESKIEDMLRLARNNFLLIYYSGHGKLGPINNNFYLTTSNSTAEKISTTALKFSRIVDLINENFAQRVGVILDCCFAGKGAVGFKGDIGDLVKASVQSSAMGIYFIGASSATQVAREEEGSTLSTLTAALVEGIQTGLADRQMKRQVSFDDLYHYLYQRVGEISHQTPTHSFTGKGAHIILVHSAHPQLRRRGDLSFAEELDRLKTVFASPDLPYDGLEERIHEFIKRARFFGEPFRAHRRYQALLSFAYGEIDVHELNRMFSEQAALRRKVVEPSRELGQAGHEATAVGEKRETFPTFPTTAEKPDPNQIVKVLREFASEQRFRCKDVLLVEDIPEVKVNEARKVCEIPSEEIILGLFINNLPSTDQFVITNSNIFLRARQFREHKYRINLKDHLKNKKPVFGSGRLWVDTQGMLLPGIKITNQHIIELLERLRTVV